MAKAAKVDKETISIVTQLLREEQGNNDLVFLIVKNTGVLRENIIQRWYSKGSVKAPSYGQTFWLLVFLALAKGYRVPVIDHWTNAQKSIMTLYTSKLLSLEDLSKLLDKTPDACYRLLIGHRSLSQEDEKRIADAGYHELAQGVLLDWKSILKSNPQSVQPLTNREDKPNRELAISTINLEATQHVILAATALLKEICRPDQHDARKELRTLLNTGSVSPLDMLATYAHALRSETTFQTLTKEGAI